MLTNLKELEKRIKVDQSNHLQPTSSEVRVYNPIAAAFAHRLAMFVKH
jgi:hypothetical protein